MKLKKIIIISIIVILALFIGFLVLNKFIDWNPKETAEKKLSYLSDQFYEHYYDEKVEEFGEEDAKVLVSKYQEKGFTISIKDLQEYLDNFKIEDYSAFDKCNKESTKINVTPISPFGRDDYQKSYILDCDF